MRGYFVTGTDTNVGKTFVSCALARRAVALGHRVFAFKPIETGCAASADGNLVGADQELLAVAAGDWQTSQLRGCYRFPLPAAPLVAAVAASAPPINIDLVVRVAREGASQLRNGLTLVEGAGGWRVPITASADMSSLARRLELPVIVVARAGLGTINHTLLTVEAVERDGCSVAAVVFSRHPHEDLDAALSNRAEILRRWQGEVVIFGADPSILDGLVSRST